jgi:hypothetical protein
MDEQPETALIAFRPGERLYPGVVTKDGYAVNEGAWLRARAAGEIVGTCRACGNGYLEPLPTPPRHHENAEMVDVNWSYGAVCTKCGHEVAAPNGHVLARSSRANEQPRGWKKKRGGALKESK